VQIQRVLVVIAAVAVVGVLLVIGQLIFQPNLPLIVDAEFSLTTISPNADGVEDVTEFSYTLSREARISITFTNGEGRVFTFRSDEPRIRGDYAVLFSGVVDGYVVEGETFNGEILRRLIPDGTYTWRLQAATADGLTDERSGTFTVTDADSALPDIVTFTISPEIFTPNQDGISDRTEINVYLAKEANLSVYLLTEDGTRYFVPPVIEGREQGEEGRHRFDYEGGVDQGMDPPPDGTYRVIAEVQDEEGQQVRAESSLTIERGGDPLAEIATQSVGADVLWSAMTYEERFFSSSDIMGDLIPLPQDVDIRSQLAVTMPVGDMLVFSLTIENYSNVPIRTAGPPPGTVYQFTQDRASMGTYGESGAWSVGIDCDTAPSDYPWRWAIGSANTLQSLEDPASGDVYYYLPPNTRSTVWGAVRMTELIEARNPQACWVGLIHEDVEVSIRNARVGAREVELLQGETMP
jgi:hypothetical protein